MSKNKMWCNKTLQTNYANATFKHYANTTFCYYQNKLRMSNNSFQLFLKKISSELTFLPQILILTKLLFFHLIYLFLISCIHNSFMAES